MEKSKIISHLVTFSSFIESADGKDKFLKLLQYSLKIILQSNKNQNKNFILKVLFARVSLPEKRLKAFVKVLSSSRKVLRLGNWAEALSELLRVTVHSFKNQSFLEALELINEVFVGLAADFVDDLYCLNSLGIVDIPWSDAWSSYLWLLGILIELFVMFKKGKFRDQPRIVAKLMCDLIFCVVDVIPCLEDQESLQTLAGLCSGSLGALKLWKKVSSEKSD